MEERVEGMGGVESGNGSNGNEEDYDLIHLNKNIKIYSPTEHLSLTSDSNQGIKEAPWYMYIQSKENHMLVLRIAVMKAHAT